ncbi:MAG TPA: 30S ribosomal protein S8 [Acidimicrobiia bacterium]|nr:30S ribosomal protein S8 [Acidimicrobiia bacterium]
MSPVTDPIADMLTRIRNAVAVGHERVSMPASKLKINIAKILVDEGFIDRYEVTENGHRSQLELVLRYAERRRPVIEGLKRVSRPGHRVYVGANELPQVQGGLGVAVVSTSQGLMPDREARKRRLGGEVLCEVW